MNTFSSLFSKTALAGFAVAVLFSTSAKADIVLSVESVTGAPGSTGAFDVLLTNTGTTSQNIAAFNFELTTANTDITFTDVTTNTATAAYIFPSSFFGPDITALAAGQTVQAGDFDSTFNGTDVGPSGVFGLGSVAFSIAPGAVNGETAEIDISAFPATNLSDSNFGNVDFTTTPGTITVQTSSTVPEPNSILLLAAALIAALFVRKRLTA
jgi:PEP-CTERM motif